MWWCRCGVARGTTRCVPLPGRSPGSSSVKRRMHGRWSRSRPTGVTGCSSTPTGTGTRAGGPGLCRARKEGSSGFGAAGVGRAQEEEEEFAIQQLHHSQSFRSAGASERSVGRFLAQWRVAGQAASQAPCFLRTIGGSPWRCCCGQLLQSPRRSSGPVMSLRRWGPAGTSIAWSWFPRRNQRCLRPDRARPCAGSIHRRGNARWKTALSPDPLDRGSPLAPHARELYGAYVAWVAPPTMDSMVSHGRIRNGRTAARHRRAWRSSPS